MIKWTMIIKYNQVEHFGMAQITFIIGNGIGMALDDQYFTLNKGLNAAWKEIKSRNIKTIIYRSLKSRKKPVTENDLRQVQDYFFKLKAIENLASTLPIKIRKDFGMISRACPQFSLR